MRNTINSFVRKIVRSIFKKDFLWINENSTVHRIPGMVIITQTKSNEGYLPVSYNYHTPKNWRLQYQISGNAAGTLSYAIKAPGQVPFFEIKFEVKLPFTLIVELEDQSLKVNGVSYPIKEPLPVDSMRLFVDFEFVTGKYLLHRKAGHRIKLESGDQGEDYFNKNVYQSYENESSHYPPEILEKIKRFHPLRGKLLDVGCATGLLVEHALALGLDAEGIDISEWAVQRANEKTGGNCRVINLDEASKADFQRRYDIIILNSVLEHLENPERALNLLYNLCNPKGVVYIQTLNAASLMHQVLKNDWGGYTDYTHKSPWISASWITATARNIGFEVLNEYKRHVWNDNVYDHVWDTLSEVLKIEPLNTLLEEQYGDIVEVILQHP